MELGWMVNSQGRGPLKVKVKAEANVMTLYQFAFVLLFPNTTSNQKEASIEVSLEWRRVDLWIIIIT